MSDNKFDNMFESLKGSFDIEEPTVKHKQRFIAKLNNESKEIVSTKNQTYNWKPILGIAASIVLIITLVFSTNQEVSVTGLASVSPEMSKTQDFFTATISSELKKLETINNPETKLLIQDALNQMKRLEIEYESLITDLKESGNDQRVIYAMISNFQNRIEILQNTLKQIEIVKQLKNSTDENNNTI